MKLVDSAKAVSYECIIEVANNLGVKLPEEYIEFIIAHNGGKTENDMLYDFYDEVTEQENTSVIRKFFSFYVTEGTEKNNINSICNIMRQEGMLSIDMIPVADDPAGNVIVISTAQEDYGVVYYLNHEYEDSDTRLLVKSKIADSFNGFIKNLYLDS